MLGVILASHGDLVYGLKDTYNMVMGDLPENVKIVSLRKDSDAEIFKKEFHEAISGFHDVDGILVLTDLEGGTPYNTACVYYFDQDFGTDVRVLTGMNFPMLVETIENMESADVSRAAETILDLTKEGIRQAEIINNEDEDF